MPIGRNRKSGRRHPNGELARPHVDYRKLCGEQPHRRDLPRELRLDKDAGTPIGHMLLLGQITEHQHEAGRRYAVIVGQYRASIETPAGLGGGGRGYDCSDIGCWEPHNCECARRKNNYSHAIAALGDVGVRATSVVERVALDGAPCHRGHLYLLRLGLDALVSHFGLTNKRKSSNSGNTH